MGVELRYATAAEWPAVGDLDGAAFGFHYSDQELAEARGELHLDRILVAVEGDRIVGVSAELPFAMTLPGGGPVPTTGLTWVSVDITRRRRGIQRALMERQVRAAAAAGDAAVILAASEGGIYGRYGFGVATPVAKRVVQRRRARLAQPVDASAVVRLTTEQARAELIERHRRWCAVTPGALRRDDRRWEFILADHEFARRGSSGLFHLVHPEGYVSYRIRSDWGEGDPQHECLIVDYVLLSPAAHGALWQTLLSMDLVGTISSYRIPPDDPLPLLLTDPRGIDTVHVADGLWLRPTGVPALLAGRRYGVDVDCVIEVRDPLLGDARYRLDGGPEGASCEPTDGAPQVSLDVAALGSMVLGGFRFGQLVRAGTADCADADLTRRLDLALLADRSPMPGTSF